MKKSLKILLLVLAVVMVLGTATTAFAYYGSIGNFPTKTQGANDNYVRALQTIIKYNLQPSLANDGVFGSGTFTAVQNYQSANGLAADGKVGSGTWSNMNNKLNYQYVAYYAHDIRIYQTSTGGYTNTVFFTDQSYDNGSTAYWRVYKAGAGSDPGTWYVIGTL
jgi:peptidoglycan hydrolase-like protein with peptidoglycan-binding domain